MSPHSRLIAVFALVVAGCVAPSAAQAAGWVTSAPVTPADRSADDPQVVLTPDGGRVVAWSQRSADGNTLEGVGVRSAPPGGDFGPAQTFPGAFDDVQLAAGADGTVALAWRDNPAHTVHIARRAPGQATFTEATPLLVTPGVVPTQAVSGLGVVVTHGDVYLAYRSFSLTADERRSDIWAARLAAEDTAVRVAPGPGTRPTDSLEGPSVLGSDPPDVVDSPAIALDRGTPVVAWQFKDFVKPNQGLTGSTTVRVASLDGSRFTSNRVVTTVRSSTPDALDAPPTIAAGGGHTYLGWSRGDGTVGVVDLSNSSVTQTLPADVQFTGNLRLGADGSGTLFASWEGTAPNTTGPTTVGTVVPVGEAPATATRLGVSRQLDDLAVAHDGGALALPDTAIAPGASTDIEAALSSHGGPFAPVEDVSGVQPFSGPGSHQAAAAVEPGGRALALWGASDGGVTRLRLSERDAEAPVFRAIAVPASATAGTPAAFTATADDNLSGAAISWDFGDGSRADGATVSHTFAAAGPAHVTVTATDSVGNSVSESRVVDVRPAPVPPVTTPPGPGVPPVDSTPPSVTKVSLTNRRFRVGRAATVRSAAAKKTPAGTTLRLTLSERATVSIAIARGKTASGTLVRKNLGPGKVSVVFSGRIGSKALKPGTYTATITATDAAGNRSKAVHIKFTVVRG
jgi:PKD repeat protein